MANSGKFTPQQMNFVVMTYERNMDKFRNIKLVRQGLLKSFHRLGFPTTRHPQDVGQAAKVLHLSQPEHLNLNINQSAVNTFSGSERFS